MELLKNVSKVSLAVAAACFVIGSSQLVKAGPEEVDKNIKVKVGAIDALLVGLNKEVDRPDPKDPAKTVKVKPLTDDALARFRDLLPNDGKKPSEGGNIKSDEEWDYAKLEAEILSKLPAVPVDPYAELRSGLLDMFKKAVEDKGTGEMGWFKYIATLEFLFKNGLYDVWAKSEWAKNHQGICKAAAGAGIATGAVGLAYYFGSKNLEKNLNEQAEVDPEGVAILGGLEDEYAKAKTDTEKAKVVRAAINKILTDTPALEKMACIAA